MAMQDKIMIDGIDVTEYRLNWVYSGLWDSAIDAMSLKFAPSVKDILTLETGMEIIVTRGYTTDTDEDVFTGQITQVKPFVSEIKLTCKNRMLDAVKSAQTKSWDKDIDTEAGVGSEIFKSICDNSDLEYDDTTIINTGTTDAFKLVKFIQNDEDDFQKMNELAEHYNYMISYDYTANKVIFKPKGYTTYPVPLTVGSEIPGQIKWKENMEQLINKVKIQGATVYDKIVETFAGPDDEFTLSKTPEDTELRKNYSSSSDLLTRGQKDVGTLGTDFDYYIDVEQKKIVLDSNISDVWINYGAQVPLPIILTNNTSVQKYGGPNKKPHFKKFAFNDIKDAKDAEDRGRAILNKYSLPFNEVEKIPVINSIIQANRVFVPGDVVQIIDPFTDKDLTLFVSEVIKSWPHIQDQICAGDQTWKTEDWQAVQMEKINRLFNELNKNQDILIQTYDFDRETTYERRYVYLEANNVVGEAGIYGHPTFGLYGTAKYGALTGGSFVLGHPTFGILGTSKLGKSTGSPIVVILQQGDNTYQEFVYDDEFYDSINSSGVTWDINTKTITIEGLGILYTDKISYGIEYTYFTVVLADVSDDGYEIYISGDGKSSWQQISINTRTAFNSSNNDGVYLKIINTDDGETWPTQFGTWGAIEPNVVLSNTYNNFGEYDSPAIKIKLEE